MSQASGGPGNTVLELKGVSKFFPGVVANRAVDFTLKKGEIHTILGENGAGKSTLMNMIAGLYPPDEGEILVQGKSALFSNPKQAIEKGIGMVHQHFMLVKNHTVAENIILGTKQSFFLNRAKVHQRIMDLAEQYNLHVSPEKKIQELSVGEQQRVEILKVLYRGAQILILDEPTAVLTPQESEALYGILRNMISKGHSIIFISHKMNEVMDLSDRITILSHGEKLATKDKHATHAGELAEIMMGGKTAEQPHLDLTDNDSHEPVIEVTNLSAKDDRGASVLKDVSMTIHEGEIVGLAGVSGNGQTVLAEVLTGLRKHTGGTYKYCGETIANQDVGKMIDRGVGYIPEDRKKYGIAGSLSLSHNFLLRDHSNPLFYRRKFLSRSRVYEYGREKMNQFDIRAASEKTSVGLLSGGNIQKAIIARETSRSLRFLLASQPIRGLDIHAASAIQHSIKREKAKGLAVLLISEDIDELMQMSDVIYVICDGKIIGSMKKEDANVKKIGRMMTGITDEQEVRS
jgi:simple sugar transport system ATP-binding protein